MASPFTSTPPDLEPPTPAAPPDAAAAFAEFVRRHQRMVWRYLRLLGADDHEADDLLQETFLRVDDPRGLTAPAAFLRSVARRLLLSARRASRRRGDAVEWTDAVDALIAREPELLEDDRVTALERCVGRLPAKAQRAIDLHYAQGLDYRATARELGLRHNGLKTLLARARRDLRMCMERDHPDTGAEA